MTGRIARAHVSGPEAEAHDRWVLDGSIDTRRKPLSIDELIQLAKLPPGSVVMLPSHRCPSPVPWFAYGLAVGVTVGAMGMALAWWLL